MSKVTSEITTLINTHSIRNYIIPQVYFFCGDRLSFLGVMFFGMDRILVSAMACSSFEGLHRLNVNSSSAYSTASPFIKSECDMNACCKSLGGSKIWCEV